MSDDQRPLFSTPLHSAHRSLGARMIAYAGWDMPVSYPAGTTAEVCACRSSAGIFDVCHMGEVSVRGSAAEAFLQFITTNDISKLSAGQAQYSLLLSPTGGVIDDIIVYRLADSHFMVVVNAACRERDVEWIREQAMSFDVAIADVSDETALIAVQGPDAPRMVARIVGESILQLKRFQFRDDIIWDDVRIKCSRTGYTGEDGFEIFSAPDAALALWSALTVLGAAPCGLASRDVLRLEAAYPLYGQELDNMHKPAESGVGWAVKSKKGEFIGREALVTGSPTEEHSTLIGLKMTDPQNAIVRVGFSVMDKQNNGRIGEITSGTLSPTVGHGIALARVERRYASLGESLLVDIRGRKAVAEVTPLPFYRNGV